MSSLHRESLLLMVAVGLTASIGEAHAQRCGDGQLSLSATGSLTLPRSFGIMGVDAAPDGRLTLWSPVGELLLVDASRQLTTVRLPRALAPVGVVPADGQGFRVIDTRTGRELLVSAGGQLTPLSDRLAQPGEAFDRAVRLGDGWVLGMIDTDARQYVVRALQGGKLETWFRSPPADSAHHIARYAIDVTPGGVLISQGNAPFLVHRIDPATGRVTPLPLPLASEPSLIPLDSLKMWRAVSAVSLDCTLLLTLSNLGNDERILVRYGADEQVDRVTRVNAPMGLVARIPGTQTVLAARRVGALELVWYDWRWVREPGSAGH